MISVEYFLQFFLYKLVKLWNKNGTDKKKQVSVSLGFSLTVLCLQILLPLSMGKVSKYNSVML